MLWDGVRIAAFGIAAGAAGGYAIVRVAQGVGDRASARRTTCDRRGARALGAAVVAALMPASARPVSMSFRRFGPNRISTRFREQAGRRLFVWGQGSRVQDPAAPTNRKQLVYLQYRAGFPCEPLWNLLS